jgi:predicted RNA-binding protein (TIGR00451 family)
MDQNGIVLFSLRPLDGHFIPSIAGAKRILATGYRRNIVVMDHDAAPFVAKGKTAFCKFVLSADEQIVPQAEVFLLDEEDQLLAVGTALHPAYAMLQLKSGPAVRVRHGNG